MLSSSLIRSSSICSSACVAQRFNPSALLNQTTASTTTTTTTKTTTKTETTNPSRQQRRTYRSDNSIYGFKEKTADERVGEVVDDIKAIRFPRLKHLVDAYRFHGHLEASTNPLKSDVASSSSSVRKIFEARAREIQDEEIESQDIIVGKQFSSLEELTTFLEDTYCGPLGIEFSHLQNAAEMEWLADAAEASKDWSVPPERQAHLATLMLNCQAFDHFMAAKFATVKRYGGEGAETMMAFFDEAFSLCAGGGVEEVVMCMPHRGRNNLLVCLLNLPPSIMFRKLKGKYEFPDEFRGTGDVLSHLTSSTDLSYEGKSVHVTLIPNPSHLEANNPVAVGKARARQQSLREGDYASDDNNNNNSGAGDNVLCLQVHGDASFIGQGVVPETFCLAYCPHFRVGGSIHLIVNNQVGYTTEAERGRSSTYSSDVGKIINCPVIHVNADFPEDLVRATKIAFDYRMKFRKDIIIDLICFRRWGHNEMDDPTFTQPLMYRTINARGSTPDLYAASLIDAGKSGKETLYSPVAAWQEFLNQELAKAESLQPPQRNLLRQWTGIEQPSTSTTVWDTGVDASLLRFVGANSVAAPEGFHVHERLRRFHIDGRLKAVLDGRGIDWATAEAMALGTLLLQDYNVRISGQDVGRGTFSQRHAMLVDQETDRIHIPLNSLVEGQKRRLELANSILSEEAVLGFEYGFSVENPDNFVIWEAQFGDFFNGAQIIIDTFVSSGEAKWLLQSPLTMLLPHGMDGMGPEHSSCRIERFLQMTDSDETGVDGDNVNMQVANPTTPAQYFHLLRRQMVRNFRKPLVVMAPKMLLRYPACVSTLDDMAPGTSFLPVLGDDGVKAASAVKRIVFVCGKHFYALHKHREAQKAEDVAIIRLEELCPFPVASLQQEVKKYPNASEFVWSQEEHRNSGCWSFVAPRFENLVGVRLHYVGRGPLATPATAVGQRHNAEAEEVVAAPFRPKLD